MLKFHSFARSFFLSSAAITLAGCQTITALNTKESKGVTGGDISIVALSQAELDEGVYTSKVLEEMVGEELRNVPDAVKAACLPAQFRDASAAAIPLIVAGLQLAYNAGAGAISSYVVEKKKRFTKNYSAHLNLPSFHVDPAGAGGDQVVTNCVWLRRTLKENRAKPATSEECKANKKLASDIVLAFEAAPKNGAVAMTVRPVYVHACEFAASTIESKREVKMQIGLGVSVLDTSRTPGNTPIATFEQTMNVPSVPIHSPITGDKLPEASAYMPLPAGQPASIAIAVVETGAGVENFEGFEDDFKANAKLIGDALGNSLKEKLAE
ncbi:MAG: hypothetical protein AAF950_18245 [Pseudomonadota bacterium]